MKEELQDRSGCSVRPSILIATIAGLGAYIFLNWGTKYQQEKLVQLDKAQLAIESKYVSKRSSLDIQYLPRIDSLAKSTHLHSKDLQTLVYKYITDVIALQDWHIHQLDSLKNVYENDLW
jgi:hypothetical protein